MKSIGAYIDEMRTLDQNNIGSWPIWAHVGAILMVSLTIVAIGAWYFVLPRQDRLEQARADEVELKQTFEAKQRLVANLGAYHAQLDAMQDQFGTLLQQLPSRTEVPSLLDDISQTRLASGLEEELFKPRPEEIRDFYAVLPNDLVVTGSYHKLGRFVSGVAALPRIVTIQDVHIEPLDNGDDGDSAGELRMSMTANTYRYLDEPDDQADTP